MPDWMNWPGWHWVAVAVALAQGIWFGWSIRAINARGDAFRAGLHHKQELADMKRRLEPGADLAVALARCKDPLECPSQEDEVEAFAHFVSRAKELYGDLSEPEPLYGWGDEEDEQS